MFKVLHEIKQNYRCCSVTSDQNDEFIAFSEESIFKIYSKYDLNDITKVDPVRILKNKNDIIHARMNSTGDIKTWKFEFSPTRNELATGCYSIKIYDVDSSELICELPNDFKYIYSLCYLDSQNIAAGNTNGSINIFSLDTLKRTHKLEEHSMPVRSLLIDNQNKKFLSASDDLHINIYDSNNLKIITPLVGHKDFISTLAVNNSFNLYASGSYDGTIKIWDIKNLKCLQTINIPNLSLNEENNSIWDISFSNDGNNLYVGSDYGFHILTIA